MLKAKLGALLAIIFTLMPAAASAQDVSVAASNGGKSLTVPLIAKNKVLQQDRLRTGYKQLADIASDICKDAISRIRNGEAVTGSVGNEAVSGFVSGYFENVDEFNTVRARLNRSMQHLMIGAAPTLEDFTDVVELDIPTHRFQDGVDPHDRHRYREIRGFDLDRSCKFRMGAVVPD